MSARAELRDAPVSHSFGQLLPKGRRAVTRDSCENRVCAYRPAAWPSTARTERCQPAYLRSRSAAASVGVKARSSFQSRPKPAASGHAPALWPASQAAPKRRRLADGGPLDRSIEDVGQELHGPVARHHAAVDAQHRLGLGRPVAVHGLQQIARLVAHGLQRGARDLARPRRARQAEERAARLGLPVRRTEADEGRHQINVLARHPPWRRARRSPAPRR